MLIATLLIITGYLMGSVSSAIIVCRLMGLPDPRTQGSRNPGATNVLRVGGKKAAAITLAGDLLKGLVPVIIARWLAADPTTLAAVGLAAFLGHLYPVFFGFQGGKGVATWLGVLFGLAWPVGLAAISTWLVMAFLFRISSLSALTAAALTPFYTYWLTRSPALTAALGLIAVILFWRHRGNIRRILAGEEGKIGEKSRG